MPRNGSGTYSLPQAAFVPNTTISSSAVNSDLSDIAGQLTNSLAADGQTTMTGAIKAMPGSAGTPAYTFGSAQTMGFYNAGTNLIGITVNGVSIGTFGTTGLTINGLNLSAAVAFIGVTDGSNAASGIVGEYLSAVVQPASVVSLTAATPKNVTSLALTAGDWDVWADCYFRSSFTDTGASCYAGLSTTTATLPTVLPFARGSIGLVTHNANGIDPSINGMGIRVSIASPATYFLVAQCDDTITGAYGQIQARRRR